MKEIICDSYEALGRTAADILAAQLCAKPDSVLGLATGSTPISTYQALIADYQAGKLDFSRARSVNLDEYCGIDRNHEQSYYTFMHENLFSHVNFADGACHLRYLRRTHRVARRHRRTGVGHRLKRSHRLQ